MFQFGLYPSTILSDTSYRGVDRYSPLTWQRDMCSCCHSSIRPVPAVVTYPRATASLRLVFYGMRTGFLVTQSNLASVSRYGCYQGFTAVGCIAVRRRHSLVHHGHGHGHWVPRRLRVERAESEDRIWLHARLSTWSLVASGRRGHSSGLTCGRRTQKC